MPALQALNVVEVRLARDGETRGLQAPDAELDPVRRHYFVGRRAEVIDQMAELENTFGDFCLELRLSGEDNDGAYRVWWEEVEQFLHRTDMQEVLEDRILKA